MPDTKKCAKCAVDRPLDEFGVDKRAKDGRQRYCKECNNAYMKDRRSKKLITGKDIKDVSKLTQLMEALPEHNNNLGEAYHSLGTTKSLEVAKVQATKFLERVSDEALETVLAQFRNPDKAASLLDAFDNYVRSVIATGTHTEQRDMFREAFRIFGWGADKHEIRAQGVPSEARQKKLEEIHNVIQGKVVETEVLDGAERDDNES